MNKDERPEDKKTRISFTLLWFVFLALVAYMNRGRMRYASDAPDAVAWQLATIGILLAIGCVYV